MKFEKNCHFYEDLNQNLQFFVLFSPYSSADLRLMAGSFNTSVGSLEDELMTLILEGKIQARIDSHNKVCRRNLFLSASLAC